MPGKFSRRQALYGAGVAAAAVAAAPVFATEAAAATNAAPLPLWPVRIPKLDMGVEQQPDSAIQWKRDAKLGMFIHWGVYAGPARGEWYMQNAAIPPATYRKYLTDASSQQFTASAFNATTWAQIAKDMGAKFTVLTTRHHEGFGLYANSHPNAWTSTQAPLRRDFVTEYVAAVRAAGLRVGLYYSPINWMYPGYYDVYGTNCAPNAWGYTTDPAHKENARIMKNEVYQAVRQLVTNYGAFDDLWWDGGWIAQQGSDADGAFFWEPGANRSTSNQWPVDAAYSENDANGNPLGLTGLVRKYQPNVLATSRSGWIGDYLSEEGGAVPTGPLRSGQFSEKNFTIDGTWGYNSSATVMDYSTAITILVNAWIRDMTVLMNVGPDRTGVVPSDQVALTRAVGGYMTTYGASVYNTRGGPWNPVDGSHGYTYAGNTFYVHILPGFSGTTFTTPAVGDAAVTRVFDVATGGALSYSVDGSGQVVVTGINRTRHSQDSVVGVTLDRSVAIADIAAGCTATASSQQTANPASRATDANTATRWSATTGATGQWLTVDLGATRTITGLRIIWENDATNYRYLVEGSTNTSTWTTISDQTATASASQVQTVAAATSVRYVRVTVTGLPSGTYASIRSLQVFDRPFPVGIKLVNRKSGKVMDVNGGSTADGAPIIQYTDAGATNQQFRTIANADGSVKLINVRSGELLTSPSGSAQGAQLIQMPDANSNRQWWKLVPAATSGYVNIVNVATGWYADVNSASTADGASVIQWVGTGGTNQDWSAVSL